MREREARRRDLTRAGTAEQLVVALIRHAQARGRDRVAEAFQAAIDLARHATIAIEEAVEKGKKLAAEAA